MSLGQWQWLLLPHSVFNKTESEFELILKYTFLWDLFFHGVPYTSTRIISGPCCSFLFLLPTLSALGILDPQPQRSLSPAHNTSAAPPFLGDLLWHFQLLPSSHFCSNTMFFLTPDFLPIYFDLKIKEYAAHTVNDVEWCGWWCSNLYFCSQVRHLLPGRRGDGLSHPAYVK